VIAGAAGARGPRARGAAAVLVLAVWHGEAAAGVDDATLSAALTLARRNGVAGRLAAVYRDRLGDEAEAARWRRRRYRRNLRVAVGCLAAAGVRPILIKEEPDGAGEYGDFDLLVDPAEWSSAVAGLRRWAVVEERARLEPGKLLLHPLEGPAAHLHRRVGWLGVTILATADVRATAVADRELACDRPGSACAGAILLAEALFQTLTLTASQLLTLQRLVESGADGAAGRLAAGGGWGRSFQGVLDVGLVALAELRAGRPVRLPVPLPSGLAAAAGWEHAVHLARRRRWPSAARELALRGPLVLAKRRRR